MQSHAEAIASNAAADRDRAASVTWWVALAGVVAVLLVPLCVVSMPPLQDYPNHLARAYVLAFGANDPFLSRMYAPDWHVIPNLAVDAVLPPLLHVLPLPVASRFMLGIVLLLPVAGVVALHQALHRRRSFWPLACCLVAYNAIFMLGFVNFSIGLGAALLVAALWVSLRRDRPVLATVALAVGASLVFFCHAAALACLGIIVAGIETQDLIACWRSGRGLRQTILLLGPEFAGGFAVTAVLFLSSRFAGAEGPVVYAPLKLKLTELLSPVLVYHPLLDGAAAICILALVGMSLFWRRKAPEPVIPPGIVLALAALLVAFVAAPFAAKGGAWLDVRFPIMAGWLLFAGLAPPPMPRAAVVSVAVAIAALFVIRTASVAQVWHTYGKDVADLQRLLAPIQPGDRVLIAQVDHVPRRAWWHRVPVGRRLVGFGSADDHIAVLLLTQRGVFTDAMFANPAQQPLRVLPPYAALMNVQESVLPDYTLLGAARLTGAQQAKFPYLQDWRDKFDYVLVMEPTGAPDLEAVLPSSLRPVGKDDIAALFRTRADGEAGR